MIQENIAPIVFLASAIFSCVIRNKPANIIINIYIKQFHVVNITKIKGMGEQYFYNIALIWVLWRDNIKYTYLMLHQIAG